MFSSFLFARLLYAVQEVASLARAAPPLLVIGTSPFTEEGVTTPGFGGGVPLGGRVHA